MTIGGRFEANGRDNISRQYSKRGSCWSKTRCNHRTFQSIYCRERAVRARHAVCIQYRPARAVRDGLMSWTADEWMEWTDGRTDGWTDGRMEGQHWWTNEEWADGQANGQAEEQTDEQTDGQTDGRLNDNWREHLRHPVAPARTRLVDKCNTIDFDFQQIFISRNPQIRSIINFPFPFTSSSTSSSAASGIFVR